MGVEVSTGIDGWPALNHCNLNSTLCQVGSERASPSAGTNNTDIKYGRHNTFPRIALTRPQSPTPCAHAQAFDPLQASRPALPGAKEEARCRKMAWHYRH